MIPAPTIAARIADVLADPAYAGLHRSLAVYYGDDAREAAMDNLYAQFIKPGDLTFDIGSHVGDRIGSFRRCAARVVALEPQPDCASLIRAIYANDPDVTLLEAACGAICGRLTLHINSANPTVSTASPEFVVAAKGAGGWEAQVWDRHIRVPVTTLDTLIETYGSPSFIKIDVEGFEANVLAGLSICVPVISFEITTIQPDIAAKCLQRLAALGPYTFNLALGETQVLSLPASVSANEMATHLAALPHHANSGDVYALLEA